jgi:hypothetical protein
MTCLRGFIVFTRVNSRRSGAGLVLIHIKRRVRCAARRKEVMD